MCHDIRDVLFVNSYITLPAESIIGLLQINPYVFRDPSPTMALTLFLPDGKEISARDCERTFSTLKIPKCFKFMTDNMLTCIYLAAVLLK